MFEGGRKLMRVLRPILILLVLSFATAARAAEPSVTAVLTDSETVVGRPVQLEIQITGASNPRPPSEIQVDGLDIRAAGTSRQVQMNNFNVSYSFTCTYTIMPLKVGTFKIPPQTVEVSGKTFQTPELTLNVAASSRQSSRSGRGSRTTDNPDVDPAQIGFLEMLLPKSVAYVGEMVPVQVRLGLNMRAPVESLNQGVQIAGQGFTTQKMTEPRQTIETINGQTYQVFIFNTAISPGARRHARDRTGRNQSGRASAAAGAPEPGIPAEPARRSVRHFQPVLQRSVIRAFGGEGGQAGEQAHHAGSETAPAQGAAGLCRGGWDVLAQGRRPA